MSSTPAKKPLYKDLTFQVVAAMFLGIASAGDIKRVGKVGLRALIYFEVVSTLALAIGLLWGNLLQIGSGMHDAHPSSAAAAHTQPRNACACFSPLT
jgi:aerobic C4-dicarboxylate transport protein